MIDGYLKQLCSNIQLLDSNIRFVGIVDYAGKLLKSAYRKGLVPLMSKEETERYALQAVFRARTRGEFTQQIGQQRYAVAFYDKLVRATLTIAHPEREYHNMYLLLSMELDCDVPQIIENKVVPLIAQEKANLFDYTMGMTKKYGKFSKE